MKNKLKEIKHYRLKAIIIHSLLLIASLALATAIMFACRHDKLALACSIVFSSFIIIYAVLEYIRELRYIDTQYRLDYISIRRSTTEGGRDEKDT